MNIHFDILKAGFGMDYVFVFYLFLRDFAGAANFDRVFIWVACGKTCGQC